MVMMGVGMYPHVEGGDYFQEKARRLRGKHDHAEHAEGNAADAELATKAYDAPRITEVISHELRLDQQAVGAVAIDQLVVSATFDDAAMIENEDFVGMADGREAVGDD
jgi:hypothetical protein